ncbi:MAG: 50S ribosomal protein L6, partial [Bosea sp. 32-68-6]
VSPLDGAPCEGVQVSVTTEDGKVWVQPVDETKRARAMWGTARVRIHNGDQPGKETRRLGEVPDLKRHCFLPPGLQSAPPDRRALQ